VPRGQRDGSLPELILLEDRTCKTRQHNSLPTSVVVQTCSVSCSTSALCECLVKSGLETEITAVEDPPQ
jgi:hypothetical protein